MDVAAAAGGGFLSGDVFGEMSLLTGDNTVADVIAGNRCFVLLIPQEVFNTRILVNPKAIAYLSRLLAERTREPVRTFSIGFDERHFSETHYARQVAERLNVPVVGSGAILLALKKHGLVTSIQPALAAWAKHGYFVSAKLKGELLARAGEPESL